MNTHSISFYGKTWKIIIYRNDPKFSDGQVLANSTDPDQTAPRGLHYLQFSLHLLDA